MNELFMINFPIHTARNSNSKSLRAKTAQFSGAHLNFPTFGPLYIVLMCVCLSLQFCLPLNNIHVMNFSWKLYLPILSTNNLLAYRSSGKLSRVYNTNNYWNIIFLVKKYTCQPDIPLIFHYYEKSSQFISNIIFSELQSWNHN